MVCLVLSNEILNLRGLEGMSVSLINQVRYVSHEVTEQIQTGVTLMRFLYKTMLDSFAGVRGVALLISIYQTIAKLLA